MRVLVVDDDDFDREACCLGLQSMGFEVIEATTPEEARTMLDSTDAFDLIISDFDLKAADTGLVVLAHAQRVQPSSRRVLMSGLLPPGVLEPAQQREQVHAYVEKPDTLDEWRAALRMALPTQEAVGATAPGDAGRPATLAGPPSPATGATARTREETLEERVRWLSAVVDLGATAHAGASLQETFDRAVRVVSETLGMEYTKILELMPGGKEVLLVAGVGWKPGLVGNARVSTGMDSQAGYTLASEHPVVAEDLRAETRFSGPTLLHEHGVVSGLSVVIPGAEGRPWGVFGAHTKARRRLTEDHVLFLRAVANVVAGAIARARTEEALRNTSDVLEREVAERTRELRTAVDDLEAFNAMAAHDLRAPLRGLARTLDLFVKEHGDRLPAEALDLLSAMGRSAAEMRDLLEALLALAKVTRDPLRMQDVDITALAKERWEHVRQREPGRDVRFTVQEGLSAHADPHLLATVLDNLLGNALKFSRDTEDALIEVGAKHLDVGGTAFFIRDNGAGFPPERAQDLFHPFKRLHSVKQFEGTGIGLATVRRVVERNSGSVWAESPGPGKGATFYFRLLPSGLP